MRAVVILAASLGLVTAPLAQASAADSGDAGPDYASSLQCAAMNVTAMQFLGSDQDGFYDLLRQGTAWLTWAQHYNPQEATAVMNSRKAYFKLQNGGLANYEDLLVEELTACAELHERFAATEPFGTMFSEAVANSGRTPIDPVPAEIVKPGIKASIDCATNFAVVSGLIGEDHENYDYYKSGVDKWSNYAATMLDESEVEQVATERAGLLSDAYVEALDEDQEQGLQLIDADSRHCVDLSHLIPDYFP